MLHCNIIEYYARKKWKNEEEVEKENRLAINNTMILPYIEGTEFEIYKFSADFIIKGLSFVFPFDSILEAKWTISSTVTFDE